MGHTPMRMSGYVKLFNSILASTIWREPNHVRVVWITLLAMAGKDGVAEGSIPGIADLARVTVEEARDAIRRLQEPDEDSRSREHEGRRILPVDGGFLLLNHAKYRQKLSADERREYLKLKQRERRQRLSTPVNTCSGQSTELSHTEAEADPEAKARTTTAAPSRVVGGLVTSPLAYEKAAKSFAFYGTRLRVPHVLHDECRAKLGGENPDAALRAWYLTLDEELERTGEPVPDVFVWLRPKFIGWAEAARLDAEREKFRPQTPSGAKGGAR